MKKSYHKNSYLYKLHSSHNNMYCTVVVLLIVVMYS